jgi:hypothetical protein
VRPTCGGGFIPLEVGVFEIEEIILQYEKMTPEIGKTPSMTPKYT